MDIKEIKKLTRKICNVGFRNKKPLTEEQRLVGPEIADAAMSLLTEIKTSKKNYTFRKNSVIKSYFPESEEPSYAVRTFLQDNSDAFYETVGYLFFGKKKTYYTENHLFYLKLYSVYCDGMFDIFVASKKGDFWIVDENLTNISLSNYIELYFAELDHTDKVFLNGLFYDANFDHDYIQEQLNVFANNLNMRDKNIAASFRCGAITFMDFLGWKGLWLNRSESNHLDKVSNLIERIIRTVQLYTQELCPYTDEMTISKFISISDTIAIFTPKVGNKSKLDILELHARIASYVLEECVKSGYAIRGAIAYGKYSTKDNIMLGPGIDECASWHESCDWIGVHYTPSAEFIIKSSSINEGSLIEQYEVPVKKTFPKVSYCVKWNVNDAEFIKLTDEAQALLPDISSKYMNTYKYLHRKEGK